MKKGIFMTALLVLFVTGLSFAQKPTATLHEQGLSGKSVKGLAGPVTGACPNNDCIFYGGDGDPTSPNADGLWQNNSSAFGIDGRVYSPFIVSKATKCGGKCNWGVDGMFANIEYYPNQSVFGVPIAVDSVNWAIVTGVAAGGSPSTVTTVCSGNDTGFVLTPTGNIYFGTYEEDATTVHVAGCTLGTGKGKGGTEYWMLVQPQTSTDGAFGFQEAYESNSPSNANAIGTAEPANDSWFYGPAFGDSTFVNANTQGPFVTFSTGVCAALVGKKG